MAEEFYRQARKSFELEEYAQAHKICMKALKAKPGHKGCSEIEGVLSEKARKLYEEGYILEDLNPQQAIMKWRDVLMICSPENTYYKKAKLGIAKYE